ncbi:MAG TPA: bacteriohopanetetrol glucosamine biosynthesis glycosyltransferase HpnI [Bryobacteraceae bacterium]|nr:bacteriohopanetetrol glucosamine biosynthesis glycosyltransferase HpnI [Bryobacteraceae bacterium]
MRLFWLIFLPAAAYQLVAIFAEIRHIWLRYRLRRQPKTFRPGISVLKPLRGSDPGMYSAFVSQVRQKYPAFEVLFGVSSIDDPAALEVRRLQQAFPKASIRLIAGCSDAANRKVGVLENLSRYAKYPILLVNDGDIKVEPDYLESVVSPLADPRIGIVTCPYRPYPQSAATTWEALGIATDFIPSTLTAPLAGVREFGLGSTLVFRKCDLEEIGGFKTIGDFLADDYHLARSITGLGKRALLSPYIVETSLGDANWSGIWQHQLRWARTIRISRGDGFAGIPITQSGIWAALACALGAWPVALALLVLRLCSAVISAGLVLRSLRIALLAWLAPFWDWYAFAIWIASYASHDVRWRGRSLTIDSSGRIEQKTKDSVLV